MAILTSIYSLSWRSSASAALLVLVCACSSKTEVDSGGRTNWLVCEDDDECPSNECNDDGYCAACPTDSGCDSVQAADDAMEAATIADEEAQVSSNDAGPSSATTTDTAAPNATPPAPTSSATPDGPLLLEFAVADYAAQHCAPTQGVESVDPRDMGELVRGAWTYCPESPGWNENEVGFEFAEDGIFNLLFPIEGETNLRRFVYGTWIAGPDPGETGELDAVVITSNRFGGSVFLRPGKVYGADPVRWVSESSGGEMHVIAIP